MEHEFSVCFDTNDIILFETVKLKKYFVIVIASVHCESCPAEQGSTPLYSSKGNVIDGSKILFFCRVDLRKNTDRMGVVCEDTGFCHMIPFFIDTFSVCAFGAVPDKTEGFKAAALGFHNIAVVDMDNGFIRDPFADSGKIGD